MGWRTKYVKFGEWKTKPSKSPPRLVICNLQQTPLDGLAAMRIGAKCDDVTRLLMQKLNIEIPEFRLRRFIKFEKKATDDRGLELLVRAVDSRGVPHDLFSKVTARPGAPVKFRGVGAKFKFSAGKKPTNVHLEFQGNYNEP